RVQGLNAEDKEKVFAQAKEKTPVMKQSNAAQKALSDIIPAMEEQLEKAGEKGIFVEPFQKFTAECALYFQLLEASKVRTVLEADFLAVSKQEESRTLIADINNAVNAAQEVFVKLGG